MNDVKDDIVSALAEQAGGQLENDPSRVDTGETPVNQDVEPEGIISEAEPEVSTDTLEVPERLEAPQHWKSDYRELFNGASPEIQAAWLEREKETDRGFQERSDQINTLQSSVDRFESVISPIRQQLQLLGQDEYAWLTQMAAYTQALQSDPASVIRQVAAQYNVDLTQTGSPDEFEDPALREMKNEIASLKQQLSQASQASDDDRQNQAIRLLENFRDEVNADGQLVHPHFNELQAKIHILATGYRDSGQPMPTLQALYDEALLMRPDLVEAANKEAQAQQAEQERLDQQKRAREARSATARPKDSAPDSGASQPLDLKEEIRKNLHAQR